MTTRVLIVDDHPRFRRSARALLESEGYEVVGEAESGSEAIALTEQLAPHALLLDVQLPDIDGFEVAERVRRRADAPRIVLVSSRDSAHYGAKVGASGALAFIPKYELSGPAVAAFLQ